ncbi:hypothetical protein DIS17_04010 [Levilactobacillus brevis]|uniref:Phage protein n=1 Tax=Levilactobacillus brevis TaxID=1580 RepID=A0AAJ5K585_LEVBR|nr:hypothetical protein [Levilactobacillus brevis]TOZ05116.1 hypothetical protein DIS17_04010 [Levilactobacillus brevis]
MIRKSGEITFKIVDGKPVGTYAEDFEPNEFVAFSVYALATTIAKLGGNPREYIIDAVNEMYGKDDDD